MKYKFKEIIYYLAVRFPQTMWGKYVTKNLVMVHWGRGLKNFGDCLQPDTLRHYSLLPVYVPSNDKSDIIMAGTILDTIPFDYQGYIIGTGGGLRKNHFPKAKVRAVRGLVSKSSLTPTTVCKLGDLGLLCRLVYPKLVKKKYKLGIIPHFIDADNEVVKKLKDIHGDNLTVISPLGTPRKIIHRIKECEHVISSSLHGLIIADCFGIPSRRWVDRKTQPLNHPKINFDLKFMDYYSSLDVNEDPVYLSGEESLDTLIGLTNLKPQDRIDQLIIDLDIEMKKFSSEMQNKKTYE